MSDGWCTQCIGTSLSGILLEKLGYYGVFSLSSVLYVLCIIYACYAIKDPDSRLAKNRNESSGTCSFLKSFFDINHVKKTAVVAFKKGSNRRRTKSILAFVSLTIIYGVTFGEWAMQYYFTRLSFNWDALKFSFFTSFYMFVHMTGALISICLFNRRLKWDDSVLGLISAVSKILGVIGIIFVRTGRDFYIAAAVEMFNATSTTALRSILTKLCSKNEIGKMMSAFNLMEVATRMAFTAIYTSLYAHTIEVDPKIMYYLSGILMTVAAAIFGWFYIQNKKELRESNKNIIVQPISTKEATNVNEEFHYNDNTDLEFTKIVVKLV
ncbi:putative peptidoglycan muropeptide transporter SLC46 [Anticarsia gemmatalis]|uniref:putative peptidoglycan muropeptide transporter SLC46 n=1 Tax=Anticarsia gemmatalis TaxID=129554 RepID=UPI003F776C98